MKLKRTSVNSLIVSLICIFGLTIAPHLSLGAEHCSSTEAVAGRDHSVAECGPMGLGWTGRYCIWKPCYRTVEPNGKRCAGTSDNKNCSSNTKNIPNGGETYQGDCGFHWGGDPLGSELDGSTYAYCSCDLPGSPSSHWDFEVQDDSCN